ncbi:MAG: metallophosphoesterase [Clostridia bacterium]|nr:metallophosphoesterase [Clostridia bacterium]
MRKNLLIAICIILVLILWNVYNDNNIAVNRYALYSSKLSNSFENYKIAFVADYHNASYYEQAAEKIKRENPDVILFGGDMVTLDEEDYGNTISFIKEIDGFAPIYMVTGNHESFNKDLSKIREDFKELGVYFLDNQNVKLYKNGDYINLYGMSDPTLQDDEILTSKKFDKYMKMAYDGMDNGVYNILLVHRANLFEKLYSLGYDAVLAGHLHGGLVRLPFVGGIVSTQRDISFPKFTKGMYFMGKSKLIVSAGMDKMKTRPRVFNGPELVIISLHKG